MFILSTIFREKYISRYMRYMKIEEYFNSSGLLKVIYHIPFQYL